MINKPRQNSYVVGQVPEEPERISRFLRDELMKIQSAIASINQNSNFQVNTSAPDKPRKGDVAYADGTLWNPSSGEGLYRFNGTSWVFLG